jgi:hypothetical protein
MALDRIRELRARATSDPFEKDPLHVAKGAQLHLWTAELERIEGHPTVESWTRAASAFDRLTWVHDAAYCRWRAAQAARADGRGVLAARLLTRAAADARTHLPLARAIAETARRTSVQQRGSARRVPTLEP